MKIVTVAQMRELERRAVDQGITEDSLMETAGLSVARRIAQIIDGIRGKRVVVLVGPGNNGGDGMVAARYLADWGGLVTLYMTTARRREDKFEDCRIRRVRVVESFEDYGHLELASYVSLSDVVIDAVLGIGNDRPLSDELRVVFDEIKQRKAEQPHLRFVALDVPSGLNADSGDADDATFDATTTLTLGAPKVGLFRFPGAEHVGTVEVLNIGLPGDIDSDLNTELCDREAVEHLVPKRPLSGHKGSFGSLLVVAGSRRFIGAPILTSRSAYRAGAGLVTLAAPETASRLAGPSVPEQVHLPLPETGDGNIATEAAEALRDAAEASSALVVGPGLGNVDSVRLMLQAFLLTEPQPSVPAVIDADALNVLALNYRWWDTLTTPSVLTPHPGEMGRLLGKSVSEVQDNRLEIAREAAREWGQVVVLKGAHTIVASPDGRSSVSPIANPALASAGTGDVLAGLIGGLLAQRLAPYDAARLGVFIHATAAGRISRRIGPSGLMASDLHDEIPLVINDLRTRR